MPRLARAEIFRRIAEHRAELEAMGVASLELFGSAARDEATDDIDILVTFSREVGLFAFYGVQEFLEQILETDRVDLILRRAVLDELKEQIYGEAVPCLFGSG